MNAIRIISKTTTMIIIYCFINNTLVIIRGIRPVRGIIPKTLHKIEFFRPA